MLRKPRTAMMNHYFDEADYDLKNSFVIGDRLTDMELAKNLGSQGIFIANDSELGQDETTANADLPSLTTTSGRHLRF